MLQVLPEIHMDFKRLSIDEVYEIILKLHEKDGLNFQEIANKLKKDRITTPRADGALTYIAVHKIYTRCKEKYVKVTSSGETKEDLISNVLRTALSDKDKIMVIRSILDTK